MGLEQYLDEIIDPTIADLQANPTSRRHAFLACVVTFHAIDYLAYSGEMSNSRNFREKFRKASPEFAVVDRVAHAFKHVSAGHPNALRNQPIASDDVIPRPPAFFGVAVWGLSRCGDTVGGVTLNRERGVDLLSTVKKAVEFIRSHLL
jgi:hypothetical protein